MTPPTIRLLRSLGCLPILAGGLLLSGCRDEPPSMPVPADIWQEAALPGLSLGSGLTSIAFSGDHGYALGTSVAKAGTDYLLLSRDSAGAWVSTQLAAPPGSAVLLDLAAGPTGLAVSGYLLQSINPALIYDERGEVPTSFTHDGFGIAAIDGDDTLMLAGGTALGGSLWVSSTPGRWTAASTQLAPTNECGFTDVFVGNGQALACGFDDAADTPPLVLRLDQTAGTWSAVPLGDGVFSLTLQCVAASADGTLMLGGIAGAGGAEPRAFLRQRGANGVWSALNLPDVSLLGGINDILPAGGGVWYVVCGGEGGGGLATILRVDGGGITRELTPFFGSLLQLAADDAGDVHAVGYRLTPGAGLRQALLLKRN